MFQAPFSGMKVLIIPDDMGWAIMKRRLISSKFSQRRLIDFGHRLGPSPVTIPANAHSFIPSPEAGPSPAPGYPRRSRTPLVADAPAAASGHTGSRWRPGSSPDFGAPALPSAAEVASVLGRPCQQYSICQERAQVPISVPPRKLPIDGKRHLCNNAGMNEPETRLELEKAAKLARELSEAVRARLEEMRKPVENQAEIDAASVELLRQSSKFTQEE